MKYILLAIFLYLAYQIYIIIKKIKNAVNKFQPENNNKQESCSDIYEKPKDVEDAEFKELDNE